MTREAALAALERDTWAAVRRADEARFDARMLAVIRWHAEVAAR